MLSREAEGPARRSGAHVLPRLRLSYAASVASGALLTLAFPEPDIAPLAWVAVAPLIVVATGESARRGFGLGFAFGVAFFGTLLGWISLVGWLGWAVLVAVEALFTGAFGAAWAVLSRRFDSVVARVVVPAVVWVAIVEYLRAHVPLGGFPWGQLAQSQHNASWMLRPARLGGGYLVAFVVVVVAGLVAEAWRRRAWRARAAAVGIAAVIVAAPLALPVADHSGDPVRVALVQGNVPRTFAGSPAEREFAITLGHARLTAGLDDAPELVVWPESAVGLDLTRDSPVRALVSGAARAVGVPMVVGGNIDVDRDRYRVVVFQIEPDGDVADIYRKTHLVPFGEYVPARGVIGGLPVLRQVPRDAVAGAEEAVFEVAGGRLAPVLSYEGDFGSLVRTRIAAGGRLLVVATNTSTWGTSWASAQHLAFSQVRAAENGVWVVHAAISGISAFVRPDGAVVARLPLWTADTLQAGVAFVDSVTPYARFGDWAPLACLAATVGLLGFAVGAGYRQRP